MCSSDCVKGAAPAKRVCPNEHRSLRGVVTIERAEYPCKAYACAQCLAEAEAEAAKWRACAEKLLAVLAEKGIEVR